MNRYYVVKSPAGLNRFSWYKSRSGITTEQSNAYQYPDWDSAEKAIEWLNLHVSSLTWGAEVVEEPNPHDGSTLDEAKSMAREKVRGMKKTY